MKMDVEGSEWPSFAAAPLPSLVFEMLLVNKRVGVVDPNGVAQIPNPLDAPNKRDSPDCQTIAR